jgi:hypothetical protein
VEKVHDSGEQCPMHYQEDFAINGLRVFFHAGRHGRKTAPYTPQKTDPIEREAVQHRVEDKSDAYRRD